MKDRLGHKFSKDARVGLFIPCYIDQFYPNVARACLELLEKQGLKIDYPMNQTCCRQPMANSECEHFSTKVYKNMVGTFSHCDFIVTPSRSCTYHIRHHYNTIAQTPEVEKVRSRTYEFVHFLTEILAVNEMPVSFPYRVGLHLGCHGQRGLNNAKLSEVAVARGGELLRILQTIKDIGLTTLDRYDECCGFGGTFCVSEEAVSSRMGVDRLSDHIRNGAEVLTGADMSCLMHLDGLVKRRKLDISVMHVAEILNGARP